MARLLVPVLIAALLSGACGQAAVDPTLRTAKVRIEVRNPGLRRLEPGTQVVRNALVFQNASEQ